MQLNQTAVKPLFQRYFPGLMLVASIASVSIWLSGFNWAKQVGLSALTLAILLGIVVGNTFYRQLVTFTNTASLGVSFSKAYLLKLGIILYGFHLTFVQISAIGVTSLLSDIIMLISTFLLTYWLGIKVFKLDRDTTILIGAGCGICGAAAILATEPVIEARSERVSIAVAVIVIFGTVAMFLYPAMYHWGWWALTDKYWGVYIGSTVHEVAQVYAAGAAINSSVVDLAVTAKMIRVMLLAPFLLVLSFWLNRQRAKTDTTERATTSQIIAKKNHITIPWFALGFIGIVAVNSLAVLPVSVVKGLLSFDNVMLTMAMAALGITTQLSDIKKAGLKPLLLGAIMMLWLVVFGGLLQVFYQ